MSLYEKYRPHTFDDVLGQDKAVKTIERLLGKGWGGNAWWISGSSGVGKTTLARIIAEQGADTFFVHEYDSADDLNADAFDQMEREMHLTSWGKGGRAWIINEAHGLKAASIRRLLGVLERIPRHCVFIFTSTRDGTDKLFDDMMDASPLISRCHFIQLTNQGLCKVFAEHVQRIARAEGMDGKPLSAYETMAKAEKNNCRAMLQHVEEGAMAI